MLKKATRQRGQRSARRHAEALPARAEQGQEPAAADEETDRPERPRIELAERELHGRPVAAPEDRERAEEEEAPAAARRRSKRLSGVPRASTSAIASTS